MVCLHYFGGSGRAWAQVAASLGSRWHCVMPDLRGFGDSGPLPAGFTVADAADDVLTMMHDLGLQRYTLAGHSMGGKIALAVAARQPPGLARLVLLAPSPPTPEPIEAAERALMLASQSDREVAERTICQGSAHALPKALLELAINDQLRASPTAWSWWLEQGSKENISGILAAINVPCQLLVGTQDRRITEALVRREVMPYLSKSNLQIIEGAAHLLPLEAPHAAARALVRAVICMSID